MAQGKYLFLGLAAVLALAIATVFVARELTVTSARTEDATMSMTVPGGSCVGSTCTVPLSGAFTLQVNAVVPPAEGYIGIQTEVEHNQLLANGGSYKPRATAGDEIVWVDSAAFELRIPNDPPGIVTHGAATGSTPPFPVSNAVGALVQLDFNCGSTNSSNVFTLVPLGPGNTNASGYKGGVSPFTGIPAKATGTLTIVCGSAVTPTNTPPTVETPTATNTPAGTPTVTNTPPGTPATPTATSTPGPTTATAVPPTATPPRTATPVPPATATRTPRTPTPTPSGGLNGDANCDGDITAVDSLWVLWDVADLSDFIPCPEEADADKDGTLTSVDSALILQFEAGLIEEI